MKRKKVRKTEDLPEITLEELRNSSENWMTVNKAAAYEGVSKGRIYQWIWLKKRKAASFGGATLVVPFPRKRKKNRVGRPRISDISPNMVDGV